jgi:hypothetical protein
MMSRGAYLVNGTAIAPMPSCSWAGEKKVAHATLVDPESRDADGLSGNGRMTSGSVRLTYAAEVATG